MLTNLPSLPAHGKCHIVSRVCSSTFSLELAQANVSNYGQLSLDCSWSLSLAPVTMPSSSVHGPFFDFAEPLNRVAAVMQRPVSQKGAPSLSPDRYIHLPALLFSTFFCKMNRFAYLLCAQKIAGVQQLLLTRTLY